jgi:hypothetical protein
MHHEHSGVGAVAAIKHNGKDFLASFTRWSGLSVFLNSVDCMYLGMVELRSKSNGEWGSADVMMIDKLQASGFLRCMGVTG